VTASFFFVPILTSKLFGWPVKIEKTQAKNNKEVRKEAL
jgi:hypothetical protein